MARKDFLKTLKEEGLLGDGAMGTEIYGRGISSTFAYFQTSPATRKVDGDIGSPGKAIFTKRFFKFIRVLLSR